MIANGLYIQMFSLHGLIRSTYLEMGRDSDTGGQIKYVMKLGQHLSEREEIGRVDIFTRLIVDKRVSADYSEPIEVISDKLRIVRIQSGGGRYIPKEQLWPHLDEYVDNMTKFINRNRFMPDIVHGHYPDAGYVAMQLSDIFGIAFVYTGHSLGRVKLARLLGQSMSEEEIIQKFQIDQRIDTEEQILARANLVIASTHHEVDQQYKLYDHKDVPRYKVIQPGIEINNFRPFYYDMLDNFEKSEEALYAQASMLQELNRFLVHPDKPLILALCRPDKRKNISGLIEAYGQDLELQAMANLAIFAGLRKDIDAMGNNEREVLIQMLLAMDKYDLYGKLAIPKKHDFEYEVPALFRITAEKHGVFVNPALTEPFGLTLLEASATGLPIVATDNGGPNDIVSKCNNGILVDVSKPFKIANALRKIIADHDLWVKYSKNGIVNVREHYSWKSHTREYMAAISRIVASNPGSDIVTAK